MVSTGGGEEAEQVLSVKDDYVGVTTIDAQATGTGPGPEGPGTRPEAKPGSKVGGGGEPCTAFNWRRRGGGELEQWQRKANNFTWSPPFPPPESESVLPAQSDVETFPYFG